MCCPSNPERRGVVVHAGVAFVASGASPLGEAMLICCTRVQVGGDGDVRLVRSAGVVGGPSRRGDIELGDCGYARTPLSSL